MGWGGGRRHNNSLDLSTSAGVCRVSVGRQLSYILILREVVVPSARLLFRDGLIHFQKDHSSTRFSRVHQTELHCKEDVELDD